MPSPVRCPGQDQRYWKPDDIFTVRCPQCRAEIEFWKDEPFRLCPACGAEVKNPRIDLGCAKWCKHAAECLATMPESIRRALAAADEAQPVPAVASLRERLIAAMKAVFGADRRRIEHALKVLGHAEAIQAREGGDPLVVVAAAILHDIGIQEAERKHGSAAAPHQEREGPPIARKILAEAGVEALTAERICGIIANHHSAQDAAVARTVEFGIVWDADALVNTPAEHPGLDPVGLEALIEKTFRTREGRARARQMFRSNR